ncbi:MAG: translation initiation factor IF-3 [Chlorobiaceae bacterium]|nr:translation initiation factor IF-3 [Chlorobiaceae bacterium]
MKETNRVRINEEIRTSQVRVIDENGQVGLMNPSEALRIAIQRGLDLIEIVPNATPPVCKIMDFGKYKYEQTKKDKLQRKHQQVTQVKELRFHPNTDVHDFEFKARHGRQFLEDGHKLKATVVFKGREITYAQQGEELLKRLEEKLSDVGKVEQSAKLEGRSMAVIFAPERSSKKKSEKKQKPIETQKEG